MNFIAQQPPQQAFQQQMLSQQMLPQQIPDALVISDLPLECKEPDLLMLAQSYGRVKSCEIKRDFRNHVISVYGILSYYTVDSAENAFRALHGARYMGKALRASWLPRTQNQASAIPHAPKTTRTAQVHISYLSKQLNFIISEQFLHDVFSNFGAVLEIALKKTCVDPEMSVQNGYGFVHYPLTNEGINSALTAVNSLHQVTINQITFDCSISNQLNQILSNMDRNSNNRGRRGGGMQDGNFHSNGGGGRGGGYNSFRNNNFYNANSAAMNNVANIMTTGGQQPRPFQSAGNNYGSYPRSFQNTTAPPANSVQFPAASYNNGAYKGFLGSSNNESYSNGFNHASPYSNQAPRQSSFSFNEQSLQSLTITDPIIHGEDNEGLQENRLSEGRLSDNGRKSFEVQQIPSFRSDTSNSAPVSSTDSVLSNEFSSSGLLDSLISNSEVPITSSSAASRESESNLHENQAISGSELEEKDASVVPVYSMWH